MNFDLGFLTDGATIVAAIGGSFAVMKFRQDKSEKDNDAKFESQNRQLEKLWNWKDSHEKEAAAERLILHTNNSRLEGILAANSKQGDDIMKRLDHIDSNMNAMREDLAELKAEKRNRDGKAD